MKVKALNAGIAALLLSAGAHADWTLDGEASSFYYVTSKASMVSEVNTFSGLSGGIADDGTATLEIDLATVNTSIEVRDERMREIVFEVDDYPAASVSVMVDTAALDAMAAGTVETASHTATVNLHDTSAEFPTELQIIKLDADTLIVQLTKPLLVNASSFGLTDAVEELRSIASLPSINPQVVVDFTLVYNKQ
jgi:polyisoprenoid-binding protein YceI